MMAWNEEPRYRNEYVTIGPYKFPHQRDAACNLLASAGDWYMHSSDVHRQTGEYFAIMARGIRIDAEDA